MATRTVEALIARGNVLDKIEELNIKIKNKKRKKYYIIRKNNETIGLMTYVSLFLGQIAYALEKGYIPIIDMKSHRNPFTNSVGEINAWELYFKQPCGIGLDQIEKGAKCIYSLEYFGPKSPFLSCLFDEKEKEFWKIIANKFIIFDDVVGSYINNEANNLLKGGKTLGLLFRGTDYTALKPKNHPIQPNVEQFIEQKKNL